MMMSFTKDCPNQIRRKKVSLSSLEGNLKLDYLGVSELQLCLLFFALCCEMQPMVTKQIIMISTSYSLKLGITNNIYNFRY